MSQKILASRLSTSAVRADTGGTIETVDLTLLDPQGRQHQLSITPVLAKELVAALCDIASASQSSLEPMKCPDTFGVGRATHEDKVLVRFEKETPYALDPDAARELACAILDECDAVDARPPRVLQ
ncbi:MAG TPA: hypothetical protein PK970_04385 [Hyphomicrobiaceae bacterium]|nr:hypothetical protein [Hyphomicrobiaceae bacterium]